MTWPFTPGAACVAMASDFRDGGAFFLNGRWVSRYLDSHWESVAAVWTLHANADTLPRHARFPVFPFEASVTARIRYAG